MSAIDEKEFLQAIEDDDLLSIRTDIVSCLKDNLLGKGNGIEAHKFLEIAQTQLLSKKIKLFVPCQREEGEVIFKDGSETQWTKHMFYHKCSQLQENFSVERYNEALALGKYLYKNGNFTQPQEGENQTELLSPQMRRRKIPLYAKIIAGAVLLAAVALVVILAINK